MAARARRKASRRRRPSAEEKRRGPRRTRAASAAAAADSIAIVYIHGIGEQPPGDELKRRWDFALFGEDMGGDTRLAYWADIRRPPKQRTLAVARQPDDFMDESPAETDLEQAVEEARVPRGQQRAAARYAEALARQVESGTPSATAPRARTRGVSSKVLPLPRWAREAITRRITHALIRDTAAYFFDAAQRKAMQDRLRAQLPGPGVPTVLVAHSQGSIIAYDVLRELGEKIDVKLLLTIGSPLGLQEVQDQLSRPLRVPAGVESWQNFADLLDPVALDKGLAGDFAPEGFVRDAIVVNEDTLRLTGFNPHSSTGYLATERVRLAVRDATRAFRNTLDHGRYIRRDVLRAMRDRSVRHPVLIELQDAAAFPDGKDEAVPLLQQRRAQLVGALERVVGRAERDDACIDPLQRFIAARLTSAEIERVSSEERASIYCIWRNSPKRKLIWRSSEVVHAPAARRTYLASGKGIAWAVLDTGVNGTHPHFANQTLAAVWDCTRTGPPKAVPLANAKDPDGHGSHVAGIVAGRSQQDGRSYDGLAPEARIHVYKVLDNKGYGDDGWIIKALDHIAAVNAAASGLVIHGVNLSLGGEFDPDVYGCGFSPICQELKRLWRQGVVVCVACGNEGQLEVSSPDGTIHLNTALSIGDPANLEECIAVGSVHADQPHSYGISYFSSRGPTADGRAKPDVVAPGEGITSCDGSSKGYATMSGTSMATPHVSGLLAAFLSARREFIGRPDEVKAMLRAHCTDIGRDRYHQGAGIPNLLRMLASC